MREEAVPAFKLVWNTTDRVWESMDPKGYEQHQAIMQHAHQWFVDHPVTMKEFMFPDEDKIEFWRHLIQENLHDEHLHLLGNWMLALFDFLPI